MHIRRGSAAAATLLIATFGPSGRVLAQSTPSTHHRPAVTIDNGKVRGYKKNGVYRFLGIPYAAPPVGDLR